MSAVGKRYARAAFDVATQQGGAAGADALATKLRTFADAYTSSAALQEVLRNPVLKESRAALLAALCSRQQLDGVAAKIIALLAENDRIGELPAVAEEVEALADTQAGRLRAHVRSAIALSDAHGKRIAQALEKRFGRPVVLDLQVQPELMGGLVVQLGDLTFDSSLKRQLEILTERLGAHAS